VNHANLRRADRLTPETVKTPRELKRLEKAVSEAP
jgi:hypothetical protein